jgi:Prp8 binding protein
LSMWTIAEISTLLFQVYSAGIETVVKAWDLRKSEPVLTMNGHSDSVTGLRLSPDGNSLLSNSMVRERAA